MLNVANEGLFWKISTFLLTVYWKGILCATHAIKLHFLRTLWQCSYFVDRCHFENIFVSARFFVHTNLYIKFLQSVNNTMEARSKKLTKYCRGTPTVKKPVRNPTAGLHKQENNKNRQ